MKEFSSFRLDEVNQCLWKRIPEGADERIPLAPKTFALLQYLVEKAGRLITHQELLDNVWAGAYVQPEVLKTQILAIRGILGDNSKNPTFIETRARRGYRFIAPVSSASQPVATPPAAPSSHLVGREKAFEALQTCLQSALKHEQRQIVFVTGEPGLGKTTLVDEFLRQIVVSEPRARVARGQCVEGYGGTEAYYPMLEALHELCLSTGGKLVVRNLAMQAPTWLVQFPALVQPEHRAMLQRELLGSTRERMLRELRELLESLTKDAPLVLVFEDLQWTDKSTVDMISAIARARAPSRLMLIATYRTSDIMAGEHPLRALKQELQLHRLCVEVTLPPLNEVEITAYLASQAPNNPLPEGLARLIHEQTDGNPLFMVAALEHLAQRGLVSRQSGHWQLQVPIDAIKFEVPETLRDIIEARIERLSAEEQQALEVASVVGTAFEAGLCADSAGLEADGMEQLCRALSQRHFILRSVAEGPAFSPRDASSRYEFIHVLYREVLYRRAPPSRRTLLHRRIAQQLEARFRTKLREAAPVLAHHFERGSDWAAAVRYLKMVAEAAGRRYAPMMAEQALQHALKLIENLPEPERVLEIEILETLATIYVICFDQRAISTHEALIKSAQHFGLIDAEVRALLSMALPAAWVSPPSYFTGVLDRALELTRHQDILARENTRLTALLWRLGAEWNFERADECRRRYDEIRARSDLPLNAGHLLSFTFFLINRSEYREALRCAREGLQLLVSEFAENSQLSNHYATYLVAMPRALTLLGEWGDALKQVEAAARAMESDSGLGIAQGFRMIGIPVNLLAMDFAGAWEFCEPLLAAFETVKLMRRDCMICATCALIGLGDYDRALALAKQVHDDMLQHPMLSDWLARMPLEAALSELWLARGDLMRAQLQAGKFLDLSLATSERTWQSLAWEVNARVAAAGSDALRAAESITNAQASMEGSEVPLAAWRVFGTAAALCEQSGDKNGAIAHRSSSANIIRRLAASLVDYPQIQRAFLEAAPVRAVMDAE